MYLQSIELNNWKCFKHKLVTFDNNLNILKWANGTGKSSLIEGIIFALFDKRPSGLDFDSLRNDISKNCRIVLKFSHNLHDYVIEREFGNSSSYRLFQDGQLISRTRADNRLNVEKIIPETVVTGLWGYNSLALSPVLKTDFLFDLLETEFIEPLQLKKYFQTDRTYNQKAISSLEKTIANQSVTQAELDNLDAEIQRIEDELKSKTYVADRDVIEARRCEQAYPQYEELSRQLLTQEPVYDRDTCKRLVAYGLHDYQSWIDYFADIRRQLIEEQSKAVESHPMAVFPRHIVERMLDYTNRSGKCICCGHDTKPITVNFDQIDHAKIERLENILKDESYDFDKLSQSVRYFQLKKKVESLEFVNEIDWRTILEKYNQDTNQLYTTLDRLKKQRQTISQDLGKITELLTHKENYAIDKQCMDIVDEYVDMAKQYYASNIVSSATDFLSRLNPRYSQLLIENGIYKVMVNNADYTMQSKLPVQSLSNGEKTLVSLSLILAIHQLCTPDVPLIMDEAFANLDTNNVDSLNSLLINSKIQWIIVSHDDRLNLENTI